MSGGQRVNGEYNEKPLDIHVHDVNGKHATMTATPEELEVIEDAHNVHDVEMDDAEKNRLLRRIDLAIIPYAALLYLLSFLDRVNIGQAKLAGLMTDLKLTNNKYNIALTVFFVSYVAFEIPSNLALKVLHPRRWIAFIMICWSICMTLMGTVKTSGQLIAVRFLLGLFEGGLFPGLNFLLTCFYTREEQGKRIAIFFAGATLAGAFGGILAFGIRHMAGIGGYNGWRWIFILEGLLTFICAIPAYWLVQDFPATSKILSRGNDRAKWLHHLTISQGVTNAEMPFAWKHVRRAFADWRTYVYALMYIGIAQPFYSLSLFTPTIIAALGYKNAVANLLSTPPYVLGFITTLGTAYFSDRMRLRGPFIIFWMSVLIVGYIILITQDKPSVSYFAIFLSVAGVSPCISTAIVWVGNNFGPITTRATTMGVFFTMGNSAGIISSWVYPTTDSPRFFKGHGVAIGFAFMAIVCAIILMISNSRENARRDRIYGPVAADGNDNNPLRHDNKELMKRWGLEGMSRDEILDLGDRHPGYRYIL
ncbi:hypothetical protein FRB94_005578 [Tulasnella sp. JGI-2019a]|nr:hypothetical protein FRB93_003923 [Tulasnella sp. JGI-2019a]KAG9000263.1 hypothetical protein FRB94_005578 [Tulasnella sp. JGI-2019a]